MKSRTQSLDSSDSGTEISSECGEVRASAVNEVSSSAVPRAEDGTLKSEMAALQSQTSRNFNSLRQYWTQDLRAKEYRERLLREMTSLRMQEQRLAERWWEVRDKRNKCEASLAEVLEEQAKRASKREIVLADMGELWKKKSRLQGSHAHARERELEGRIAEVDATLEVLKKEHADMAGALEAERKRHADVDEALSMERRMCAESTAALRTELESEKDKTLCVICMDRARNILILPCSHFLACEECMHKQRSSCPACRGHITALLVCKIGLS